MSGTTSAPATGRSAWAPAREGPSVDAIVVAAGRSARMGGLDKLDARVGGRALLARSVEAMAASPVVRRIVLVVAADRVDPVRTAAWLPRSVVEVVAGGTRRQDSVAAGLAAIDALDRADGVRREASDAAVVLIHDGARPLASAALVARVAEAAAAHGAAIPVLPLAETLKRLEGDRIVATVDRSGLATAQTPQGFRRGVLRAAHGRLTPAGSTEWTDEAALLEACRIPVHVVPGEPTNLKVTVPGDLARVDALLRADGRRRIGIGRDSHPFGPGAPLALGGVEIPGAPRLHGHSDGDVVLHAVADALLGASGLGDLGRTFPAGPDTPRGIASTALLAEVVRHLEAVGQRPAGIDVTIVAARPRLARHLDGMRDAIAGLLSLTPDAVNVKASTGNLAGMEGAGRGASAIAVAELEPIP